MKKLIIVLIVIVIIIIGCKKKPLAPLREPKTNDKGVITNYA